MYSDELKLVFELEPSGLFENVIFAPAIGRPRASSLRTDDEDSRVGVAVSGLVVVEGASVVIFGTLIFGILNCPTAGSLKNDAAAITAININDHLDINNPPF